MNHRFRQSAWPVLMCLLPVMGAGCQSGQIFYRPAVVQHGTPPRQAHIEERSAPEFQYPQAVFAELVWGQSATSPAGQSGQLPPATRPAEAVPATRPVSAYAYTPPSSPVRNMEMLTTVVTSAAGRNLVGGGREAAEAGVAVGGATDGAGRGLATLGAPQANTVNAVVGQPGLQQGIAIGLGLVPANNLFTRQVIRLTGSTGRCHELVNAGFFDSVAECEEFFRR